MEDQAAAVELTITGQVGPVVVVAHSGANAPVSLLLDRSPHLICRVVWVDSGPLASRATSEVETPAEVPLPPFEVLGQQASLEGLSPQILERFRKSRSPRARAGRA